MENSHEILRIEEKFLHDFSVGRNKLYREQGKKFVFRKLEKEDYDNGLFECLSQLTSIGSVSKEEFERRFDSIDPQHSSSYKIIVGVDKDSKEIVCYGTILFELKFVHNLGV